MKYYSTRNKQRFVEAETAILGSLAPDGGLFFPEHFPDLSASLHGASNLTETGRIILTPFFAEAFEAGEFEGAIDAALNFAAPIVTLAPHVHVLELFHGPSLAFKDFGARVMAELMSRLAQKQGRTITIVTATSGDTGGAVVQAFLGKPATEVVVLYPKGRVSDVQEKQMTTAGRNIEVLEIDGSFDDCQAMVKAAFLDPSLAAKNLVSANSINIARLLPQAIYYADALRRLNFPSRATFVVPSGNFGNIFAGMALRAMAFPELKFLAATNANATFGEFMNSGVYSPRPSLSTMSNAMDVGAPSNLERIRTLTSDSISTLRSFCGTVSVSDDATISELRRTYEESGYLACPHTAVALSAARELRASASEHAPVIALATAHPAKFKYIIESRAGVPVQLPDELRDLLSRPGQKIPLGNTPDALRQFLSARASKAASKAAV